MFFGSLATLMNSVFALIAYSFTEANSKSLIFSIHQTFFATTALACIFVPKIEILVFHPEKDTLFDALSPSISFNIHSTSKKSNESKPTEEDNATVLQ